MRLSLVLLAALAAVLPSCESSHERAIVQSSVESIIFSCDPGDTFPLEIGTFYVQIFEGQLDFLEPSTITATFTSDITLDLPGQHVPPQLPVRLSLASGSTLNLGATAVDVLVDNCDFSAASVRFIVEVVGRRKDDQTLSVTRHIRDFTILNINPPRLVDIPQLLVEAVLGNQTTALDDFTLDAPTGVRTCNPAVELPDTLPAAEADTFQVGAITVDLTQQQLDDAFLGSSPRFPLGTGPLGITLESFVNPVAPTPGRYLIAWQCVLDNIPDSPSDFRFFELFLDRDNDPSNNFEASLEKSTTNDVDTWYTTLHQPGVGWAALAFDAQDQTAPQRFPSGVRVILYGQVQLFVVPLGELGDPTSAGIRMATFIHTGTQGRNGQPWSADSTPPVGEPLIAVTLTPGASLDESEAEANVRRGEHLVRMGEYPAAVEALQRAQQARPRWEVQSYLEQVERVVEAR